MWIGLHTGCFMEDRPGTTIEVVLIGGSVGVGRARPLVEPRLSSPSVHTSVLTGYVMASRLAQPVAVKKRSPQRSCNPSGVKSVCDFSLVDPKGAGPPWTIWPASSSW